MLVTAQYRKDHMHRMHPLPAALQDGQLCYFIDHIRISIAQVYQDEA